MKGLFVLSLMLLCQLTWSQSREDLLKQFHEQRKEMLNQIQKMFHDSFMDDPFFNDDFDPFGGLKQMRSAQGDNVKISEEYKENGEIHIKVMPQSKSVKLEIETDDNSIVIKSETKVEEETKEEGSAFKSYSSSSYRRSIPVPNGYKVKESKQIKEGWLFVLASDGSIPKIAPRKKIGKPKPGSDKTPLGPQEGETII